MKNIKLQIYLFFNKNAINCTTEKQPSPVCGIYIYLYEFQNMVGVMVAMVLMRNRLVVENGGGVRPNIILKNL